VVTASERYRAGDRTHENGLPAWQELSKREGDRVNAILCACGYNLRKLLAHIFCFLLEYRNLLYIAKSVSKTEEKTIGLEVCL